MISMQQEPAPVQDDFEPMPSEGYEPTAEDLASYAAWLASLPSIADDDPEPADDEYDAWLAQYEQYRPVDDRITDADIAAAGLAVG